MRKEIKSRTYRLFTYQPVDRVPDLEFGYWPQTIRRWLREGMPLALTSEEQNGMFVPKLDAFFGFDQDPAWHGLPTRTGMHPVFERQEIERCPDGAVIVRDESGCLAKRYLNDAPDSSIPQYLKFPVEKPEDWSALKERFRLDGPERIIPPESFAAARQAAKNGACVQVSFCGFYGQLRNWMGMENLSMAFYDFPDMIHDMVTHWAELCARQIEQCPADLPIDWVSWWEDMACKNGPLCGPDQFREFLQPGYHRVMQAAQRRGCVLSMVDCDGNPHDIVANWLEEGVNIMFPLEVAAGVDPFAWRKEWGKALLLRGGIAKEPLVHGGAAIDRELDRIKPLLEQGGYFPHLDHLVPPDISYRNYCEYLDKKRKLIGK